MCTVTAWPIDYIDISTTLNEQFDIRPTFFRYRIK